MRRILHCSTVPRKGDAKINFPVAPWSVLEHRPGQKTHSKEWIPVPHLVLATGQITRSDQLVIELVRAIEAPAIILIGWPSAPTVTDNTRRLPPPWQPPSPRSWPRPGRPW